MALTSKQKQVYEFIQEHIRTHQIAPTQKEIKEHFSLKSFGSVQRYLKYLSDEGLISSDWNARRGIKINSERPGLAEVPLLGSVAAGHPLEKINHPDEFVEIPKELTSNQQGLFALRVEGESMVDEGILDGDTIICRNQVQAKNNDLVVALIDHEATLKRFEKKADRIVLWPRNPRFKPIEVFPETPFSIAGVVVGLIRTY